MIPASEAERRLRRVSQLRAMILEMRRQARKAYEAGKLRREPAYSFRSDPAHWRRLAAEKGIEIPG